MGFLKSFTSTVQKGLDQTVGELKPGGKAWDPYAQQVAQMAQRKKDQGRIASNLAVGQGASLLTGPRPNLPA